MTGPRPAGRPWTPPEVAQLHELIADGVKVGLIARRLKPSPGAIHSCISSFKKALRDLTLDAKRLSLPSERLAFNHRDWVQAKGEAMKLPPVVTPAWTKADDAKLRSLALAGAPERSQ
jgi:hypothetical protein